MQLLGGHVKTCAQFLSQLVEAFGRSRDRLVIDGTPKGPSTSVLCASPDAGFAWALSLDAKGIALRMGSGAFRAICHVVVFPDLAVSACLYMFIVGNVKGLNVARFLNFKTTCWKAVSTFQKKPSSFASALSLHFRAVAREATPPPPPPRPHSTEDTQETSWGWQFTKHLLDV